MVLGKRIVNILKFGIGARALEKKRAEKATKRRQVFESERWERDNGLAQRKYQSYADYADHQASKLTRVIHRLHETAQIDEAFFKKNFEQCPELAQVHSVLCLGARIGTEVKVLRSLGYFAIGIDLNPGKDNPYVLTGDFHDIDFPDHSVDAIFTNSLDHAYDVDKVLREVYRVLKHGGLFIADIHQGYTEGFTPGDYESLHWQSQEEFIHKMINTLGMTPVAKRELGQLRRDFLTQVVFRKPESKPVFHKLQEA